MTVVRRHLTDLYQTGRELTFKEGEKPILDDAGEPVLDEYGEPTMEPIYGETVWVQKLTLLDHKAAVRRADAAKAVILIASRDKDGDEWKSALSMVDEVCRDDRDLMIDYLIADKLASRQEAIGGEVEGEEVEGDDGKPGPNEWKKDNYLQGLFDAWNGVDAEADSLKVRFAQDANDPEAKRVFEEMARFIAAVDERMEEERLEFLADIGEMDLDQLRTKIAELHLESRSNQVFWEEFSACRIYLGLRKAEKHATYYLQSREDVEKLHPSVAEAVLAAIEEMAIDVTEGKGLPATRITSR